MDFWETEKCVNCGGTIVEKRVEIHRTVKGVYTILIENVPAGVCTSCGARFYVANVLDKIEQTIRCSRPRNHGQLPIYSRLPLHNIFPKETEQENIRISE